ncbi:S-adenosyl-L-methionine-dependent methyltransferase [Pisolithus orientalis]|uniref:S-adenosyl-L-methionine-dependent methyltransferase n=1 Tax=Pisolithus orientalis TaxID=936130 RepID=UPI0022251ADB|nr:S-adenosyl-L-methionine-dependent methyltransferase [Pisolithus orientalis]KAI5989424.1 S-adenosyl-L-methionine-dependent methyltransferase [Pisolithus orientalis]
MSATDPQPSKLGTKEHWDNVYDEELQNFGEFGDEGEIWFGEDSVDKMVNWAVQNVPPENDPSILEVGSGNGTLLFALAEAGYTADTLLGIDYSEGAITLASSIAKSRNREGIQFHCCDFLNEEPPLLTNIRTVDGAAWDLILDKGTFDAIALMQKDNHGKAPVDGYPLRVARLLKPGAHFLITSCNFTEAELQDKFTTPATGLRYHSRIQHQTYTFGGRSGSICSSVAFVKPAAT